jgi:hypothetical protein
MLVKKMTTAPIFLLERRSLSDENIQLLQKGINYKLDNRESISEHRGYGPAQGGICELFSKDISYLVFCVS